MSRPMADTPKRRARRQCSDEFKASAVRLVLDDGKRVGAAANVLARDFTAAAPNQRRVSDTTQFVIGDSAKLYLVASLDLFSADEGRRYEINVVNPSTESDQAQR